MFDSELLLLLLLFCSFLFYVFQFSALLFPFVQRVRPNSLFPGHSPNQFSLPGKNNQRNTVTFLLQQQKEIKVKKPPQQEDLSKGLGGGRGGVQVFCCQK
jgi:hypothetical protein